MTHKPRSAGIHPGPGFRIQQHSPLINDVVLSQLAAFPTPDISDQLNRLYAVDADIRCLTPGHARLCGSACTVKVFPGDNLMVHKALDIAQPGQVVVIDAGASPMNAVLGDIICTKAKHRHIAGFIVDGLVRDLSGIGEVQMPVFARGTTPVGPLHRGPGEINFPIACGGVVVNPGDAIVADEDGIVVVPRGIIDDLLHRLQQQLAASQQYLASVQQGQFSNEWVDALLASTGCTIVSPTSGTGLPSVGNSQPENSSTADSVTQ